MAFNALKLARACRLTNLGKIHQDFRGALKTGLSLKQGLAGASVIQRRNLQIDSDDRLIYEGPLSKTVKYAKRFSLTTCAVSLIGCPFLVMYGKASVPFVGKLALAATVLLMGTTTTFILHWFTRVYVHRMWYNPQKKSFAVETMNVFARRKMSYFPIEHVDYPISETAFSTFSAQGKNFFLHMELKEAELVMSYIRDRNVREMQD